MSFHNKISIELLNYGFYFKWLRHHPLQNVPNNISLSNALTKSREMKAQFRTLTGTVQLYCYERRRLPPTRTLVWICLIVLSKLNAVLSKRLLCLGPRKTIHKYMVQCPLLPSIPPTLIPSTTPPFFFSPAHVTWSSTAAAGDSFPSSTCIGIV